jgi:hypothetical protein
MDRMKRTLAAIAAALFVGLVWLVGQFVHEYFHPLYINGTIRKGR